MTTKVTDSAEFLRRTQENTTEYHRQEKADSFDLKKFHGFDALAGEVSRSVLARKANDIMDAVVHSMLPILHENHGTDAYRLNPDGSFSPVELKSTYTDESKFFKTESGAIYSVTLDKIKPDGTVLKNNTTSFKSNFNATYEIRNNLEAKNMDMYLTIRDSRTDYLVDCYHVPAKEIFNYLKDKNVPKSGSVPIKLTTCMKIGTRVETAITDIIGIDNWKKTLLPTLPTIKVVHPPRPTQSSTSSEDQCSTELSKTDSTQETSTPYMPGLFQLQIQDFLEQQPSVLSEKS